MIAVTRHLMPGSASSRRALVAATVLVMALAACGSDPLDDDPSGQRACELLTETKDAENLDEVAGSFLDIGEAASSAETEGIRDSVINPDSGEAPLPDLDLLADACEDAGFDIPD